MYYVASNDLLWAISGLLGISYTFAWSLSFYPQVLLNVRRRSTSGTTPSYPVLNVLGFACYTVSTLTSLTSATVQREYRDRHHGADNTVRWNDFAFAFHALILSTITLSQYFPSLWRFEPRRNRVGNGVWIIIALSLLGIIWTMSMAFFSDQTGYQWLDVIHAVGYVKLLVTLVKYAPQAYHNFERKSTVGWSIQPMILDFAGGVLSIGQLLIDSILEGDLSGLTGNPVKLGLGNVSITFDILFMIQHYVLYRVPAAKRTLGGENEGLLGSDEQR